MRTWSEVVTALRANPYQRIVLPKNQILHPQQAGFYPSVGLPKGQVADWRFALADCAGVHVWDCGALWKIHLDQVDPSCSVPEHLLRDAPEVVVPLTTAAGAAAGAIIGGGKGALIGGGLGALLGMLALKARAA